MQTMRERREIRPQSRQGSASQKGGQQTQISKRQRHPGRQEGRRKTRGWKLPLRSDFSPDQQICFPFSEGKRPPFSRHMRTTCLYMEQSPPDYQTDKFASTLRNRYERGTPAPLPGTHLSCWGRKTDRCKVSNPAMGRLQERRKRMQRKRNGIKGAEKQESKENRPHCIVTDSPCAACCQGQPHHLGPWR